MKIFGPKLSMFIIILSLWGIIQLSLMGFFFSIHALTFVEDLPEFVHRKLNHAEEINKFLENVDMAYEAIAYNCYKAAFIYILTLIFSVWQFKINCSQNYPNFLKDTS